MGIDHVIFCVSRVEGVRARVIYALGVTCAIVVTAGYSLKCGWSSGSTGGIRNSEIGGGNLTPQFLPERSPGLTVAGDTISTASSIVLPGDVQCNDE